MLVPQESSSTPLVMVNGKSESTCNRFHKLIILEEIARFEENGTQISLSRTKDFLNIAGQNLEC